MRTFLFQLAIVMGSISMAQPMAHAAKLILQSSAFKSGEEIPKKYTGDGSDVSPPLNWSGIPQGTHEFVLICDDPDAPTPEPWVHWVGYGISASTTQLPEALPAQQKLEVPIRLEQGINSFDHVGYNGPMPPVGSGWHRYFFKLYALDIRLNLPTSTKKETLLLAVKGHILAESQIMGRYQRK